RIIVAPVVRPVLLNDVLDGFFSGSKNIQPEEHRPDTVLLSNVIPAGSETLLTAKRRHIRVHEIAEELPAGRRFVAFQTELFLHPVSSSAGGHRASDAGDAILVCRN